MLTSIDREGTGSGFDLNLIKMISNNVEIPVIAHGGASNVSHIIEAINSSRADAVSIASMLHYPSINRKGFSEENFDDEGNIEFLKKIVRSSCFTIKIYQELNQLINNSLKLSH